MLSINNLRVFWSQTGARFCDVRAADCFVAVARTKQFLLRETIFRFSCRRPETLDG
jgi:hypothetical protein